MTNKLDNQMKQQLLCRLSGSLNEHHPIWHYQLNNLKNVLLLRFFHHYRLNGFQEIQDGKRNKPFRSSTAMAVRFSKWALRYATSRLWRVNLGS